MRAATPQGFAAVIEAGAAVARSHATAEEGAVLGGRWVSVRLWSSSGIQPKRAATGKTCDWVGGKFR